MDLGIGTTHWLKVQRELVCGDDGVNGKVDGIVGTSDELLYFVSIWCGCAFSYKTQRMNDPYRQCTMDPTQHPGFQQQPSGSTVGSIGYPPPPPPGCPLPPPPGYPLPPPPLGYSLPMPPPPGVTAQQQYLLYPPMPPQGYGQYLQYQGWGPYGAPVFPHSTGTLSKYNDASAQCYWCGTYASASIEQDCRDAYKSSNARAPPASAPPALRQYMNHQREPGGK